MGEIWDEHDEVTEDFRKQSDGSWLVSGSASVDDLYEELDLPEEEDIDSNTVNGLVQEKTCHLPKVGDRFTLGEYDGVVTRTAKRRVTEVRLTPAAPAEDARRTTKRISASPALHSAGRAADRKHKIETVKRRRVELLALPGGVFLIQVLARGPALC